MSQPSSSPQKRRRLPAAEAREIILDAATSLLKERGVHALKLVEIAKAAGMGHSSVLHHFNTVDALHEALIVHIAEKLTDEVASLVNQSFPRPHQDSVTKKLFSLYAEGQYSKLFAWAILSNRTIPTTALRDQLARTIELISSQIVAFDYDEKEATILARRGIHLLLAAAIGNGLLNPIENQLFEDDPAFDIGRWLHEMLIDQYLGSQKKS